MNIVERMVKRFGSRYKVTRQKNEGSYINGRWQPTSKLETFEIVASIQPIDGNQLQLLPEGERTSEMRNLYTATKLNTANEDKTINADIILIGSDYWEVQKVETWSPNLLNHFKCLIVRINRQE